MEERSQSIEPGAVVGPYEIERSLGRSGAALEYLASGPGGSRVRLRLVDAALAADPEFRGRFEREARIAREVEHPNVVGVIETGEHDGALFLAQPQVGERTLADELGGSAIGAERAVAVGREVGAALDAIHGAGVVHRDVCPANVILAADGSAHLGGLALAKDTQGTALTEAGTALGSLDYMAPEQIRGEQIGPAADVYALACVIFECLAGRAPFADRKGMRVLWAHLQDAPPSLAEVADAGAGRELGEAVARGLAKDPEARPSSASQFARVVELAWELER